MVQVFEVAKVLVHQICDKQVEPPIVIHIRTGDARGGTGIHHFSECRGGNVYEGAVLHV